MIGIVQKHKNQPYKISITARDAEFEGLEHNDTVDIVIRKVTKK